MGDVLGELTGHTRRVHILAIAQQRSLECIVPFFWLIVANLACQKRSQSNEVRKLCCQAS
jgi:hypothetical protein